MRALRCIVAARLVVVAFTAIHHSPGKSWTSLSHPDQEGDPQIPHTQTLGSWASFFLGFPVLVMSSVPLLLPLSWWLVGSAGQPHGALRPRDSELVPPSIQRQLLPSTVCVLPRNIQQLLVPILVHISCSFTPLGLCPRCVCSSAHPSTSSLQFL